MRVNDFGKFAVAIAVPMLAGVMGSVFTTSAIPVWYAGLVRPALAPPNWVFAPVWTVLFALMGVAAFLVWRRGFARNAVRIALGVFVLQLALNVFWSAIFFGLRNPGAAFVEIIGLWLAILVTVVLFARVSRPAAYLLVPYLAWVSFAMYLNAAFWLRNA